MFIIYHECKNNFSRKGPSFVGETQAHRSNDVLWFWDWRYNYFYGFDFNIFSFTNHTLFLLSIILFERTSFDKSGKPVFSNSENSYKQNNGTEWYSMRWNLLIKMLWSDRGSNPGGSAQPCTGGDALSCREYKPRLQSSQPTMVWRYIVLAFDAKMILWLV